jgi:hypothetical protein
MMKIPAVGSKVEVLVRLRNIYIDTYKTEPFQNKKFSGIVVKSDRWVPADWFSVNTGDPYHPVSVISSKSVVDIKLISGKLDSPIRQFKVKGSNEYIVTLSAGRYTCECVGFKYHNKCRHIEAVKKTLDK